jgi:hypothetical protein
MKPAAFIAGLALLAVACTVKKQEDAATSDSAVVSAPAPSVTTPAAAPAVTDSTKISAKLPRKKTTSRTPAADSERDSATQPIFEIGADGKIRRVKK